MASHQEPPAPGGFCGDLCSLCSQVVPRARQDIPKAGNQEPGPCLRSSPAFTIPLPPLLFWHQGSWAGNAATGAQSFLLSSSVGHGCPSRATGSPALQLPLSRMRKYWICFVKGREKKKKIQYSVCDPRLRAWLWQENAVNLPFPHQLGEKNPFSFNILIFLLV